MHTFKIGLGVVLLVSTSSVLANDTKKTPDLASPNYSFLDGDAVADLLSVGAFWCMEPEGDTCSFSAQVTRSDGYEFSYEVVSFWDETLLLSETYSSSVTAEGVLCEPDRLNVKAIKMTDLEGNPVESGELESVVEELRQIYEGETYPDRCFRYAIGDDANPDVITQFVLDDNGQAYSPLPFIVDYAPDARDFYTMRWED